MLSRQNDVPSPPNASRALPSSPSESSPSAREPTPETRGLSLLAHRALSLLRQREPLPEELTLAAERVLSDLPLELAVGRFDMFNPPVRRALPPRVVESWRFYAGVIEARGWGVVHVLDLALSEEHGDVLLVHAVTHAGEGYLEVYDDGGAPLTSGASEEGRVSSWDESFADVRSAARALVVS